MSYYVHTPLIAVFINIFLVFLVLLRHHRSSLHKFFSLFLLSMALWGFTIFGMRSSPDAESALMWDKAVMAMGPWTSVFFYHFSLLFTRTKPRTWLVFGAYLLCILFSALAPTDLLFKGMQVGPYGYAPIIGVLGYPAILAVYLFIVLGLAKLARFRSAATKQEERNRTSLIIAGAVCALIGGGTDIVHAVGVSIPPLGIIGNILFGSMATVAILRYHLLDIKVAIRKSLAYLLVSLVIAVPYVSILLFLNQILRPRTEPWWVHTIIVLLLAILLRPLYSRAQNLVDRLFYRDRYDYLKALENFSRQTQSLTDSAQLGSTMVNLIAKALRSSNVWLLQPLPHSHDFSTAFSTSMNNPTPAISLNKDGALVKWLERSNSMLPYEDIEIIPQLQGMTSKERETLEQVGTELISPLKAPTGQLSGILILGEKLSEQPYTSEDKQLIYTICNHMSTNLENARLYSESQQEVEERRRAEKALREGRKKYKLLFESTLDGMLVFDAETMKIVLANQAAADIYGLNSAEEAVEVDLLDFVPLEERERVLSIIVKDLFKNDLRQVNEFRTITRDGREIWISAVGTRTEYQGKLAGLVSFRDITERKEAEEREKELQQELLLSSRLASVGELAAGVAHQINNPLTGVLGFSQRLLRKSTDEEVSQDLKRIYNEAERAAKVVQNLLTFARRRESHKQYSDINEIVKSALELRAYELKTSNIEAVTDLAPSLPQVMLDFHQIQEVFLNIILNAEQAMTEANSGGRLNIKTEEKKGYIRTTFTDDGPGIPVEHLNKIFDPFFSTRGERGGTGLGLSVCHGIITEHSGRIYAKSKPGKGAAFFVELPITSETANKHMTENE